MGGPPGAYPPGGMPPAMPPPRKGNSGIVLLIVVVSVVLVLVVGVVGAFLWFGSRGGDSALARYEGTWDGELVQYDASGVPMGTWSANISVAGDRVQAGEYGLSGGGDDGACTWDVANVVATESRLTFSYTVTGDPDCADNGEVTLAPAGQDAMATTVTNIMGSGEESVSEGTLHRE
jgi:hypothetical protein